MSIMPLPVKKAHPSLRSAPSSATGHTHVRWVSQVPPLNGDKDTILALTYGEHSSYITYATGRT